MACIIHKRARPRGAGKLALASFYASVFFSGFIVPLDGDRKKGGLVARCTVNAWD